MPTDEKFDRMIDRYVDGKMSPEEAKEFHALLAQRPELQDSLDAERLIRQQLIPEKITTSASPPSEKLLSYLAATPARRRNKLVYGLAAALLSVILAMLLWPVSTVTNRTSTPQFQGTSAQMKVLAPVAPIVSNDSLLTQRPVAITKPKHSGSAKEEQIDLDAHLNKPKVYIKDPHIR